MKTIRQHRTELGMTQAEVAIKVGVSMMSYQLWERGAMKPNEENYKKLKEVLKLDE